MIYLAIFLILYILPLALTALVALILYKLVFQGRRWGAAISMALALALSCIQPVLDRVMLRRELARYAPDELRPETLALTSGPLLIVQESRHAAITCNPDCPIDSLPFVTGHAVVNLAFGAQEWPADLRKRLPETDPAKPFPYRYALVAMATSTYAEVLGIEGYRKPDWPPIGHSRDVNMLVEIPESGVLDLTRAQAHFRRFNIQADVAQPPFWGFARFSTTYPDEGAIFRDLLRVSQAQ